MNKMVPKFTEAPFCIPCTGESSTLPYVLGFLGLALILFIISRVLSKKEGK